MELVMLTAVSEEWRKDAVKDKEKEKEKT